VLDDHSAANFHVVGCGGPYCGDRGQPSSVGGSLTQSINFGKCVDQSYTFGFSYQASGDYGSPCLCRVGFEVSGCKDGDCIAMIQAGYDQKWYITSTSDGWHTWSHTFSAVPEAEDRNLDLSLGLSCQWYSQVDILVKDLTLGPATA